MAKYDNPGRTQGNAESLTLDQLSNERNRLGVAKQLQDLQRKRPPMMRSRYHSGSVSPDSKGGPSYGSYSTGDDGLLTYTQSPSVYDVSKGFQHGMNHAQWNQSYANHKANLHAQKYVKEYNEIRSQFKGDAGTVPNFMSGGEDGGIPSYNRHWAKRINNAFDARVKNMRRPQENVQQVIDPNVISKRQEERSRSRRSRARSSFGGQGNSGSGLLNSSSTNLSGSVL